MADEVIARLEELGDLGCLFVEVDALDRIVRRITGPIDDHEPVPRCEPALRGERQRAVHHASMDQHEPRARADGLDVH